MVRTISHRELRNNSSAILREVQSGETFRITNHGEVVGLLIPQSPTPTFELPIRKATVIGGFDELPTVDLGEPIQQALDLLRDDR